MSPRRCSGGAIRFQYRATGFIVVLGMLLLTALMLAAAPPGTGGYRPECREQVLQADLDHDGSGESYILKSLRLTVAGSGSTIWQSPPSWQVTQFVLADSNNDGIVDLNMVVWKRGSFGAYRPFWFKGEDEAYCNHLFVFDLRQGRLAPVWMSSKLDDPIACLSIYDADADGRNELVVSEQPGSLQEAEFGSPDAASCGLTLWRWQAWGFSRVL